MIIAIAGLFLVVVFLASKPVNGPGQSSGNSLPDPPPIPATGTSGVPSPATSITAPLDPGYAWMQAGKGGGQPLPPSNGGGALLATNIGQLIAQTNASLPASPWVGNPPPPPKTVVTSAPTSVPLASKELFTGVKSTIPISQSTASSTLGWRKL